MARSVRIEYEGARYHVMSRGDRGEPIMWDNRDGEIFVETLFEACERSGAEIFSYVLMGNHYHLLVGTPHGNLVATMKWFQGTYTARFNARHRQRGHVFQGRYKAIPVDDSEPGYGRIVSDYIHLNPVRAGIIRPEAPDLAAYQWSSYPGMVGEALVPEALQVVRVLDWHHLDWNKMSDRKRYGAYLHERAAAFWSEAVNEEQREEWEIMRRGWFLGGESFRELLQERAAETVVGKRRDSYADPALGAHDELAAANLLAGALEVLGLAVADIRQLRKNDPRKQAVASMLRTKTVVSNAWICEQIAMGDDSNIRRAVARIRETKEPEVVRLKQLLHICRD